MDYCEVLVFNINEKSHHVTCSVINIIFNDEKFQSNVDTEILDLLDDYYYRSISEM
jgi:hypothetical protein